MTKTYKERRKANAKRLTEAEERESNRALAGALGGMVGKELPEGFPVLFPLTLQMKDPKTDVTYAGCRIESPDAKGRIDVLLAKGVTESLIYKIKTVLEPFMDKGIVKEIHFRTYDNHKQEII